MLAWHAYTTAASPDRSNDQAAAQSATLCEPKRRIGFLFAEPLLGRVMPISDFMQKSKNKLAPLH
jgi:hypothetical protein